MPIKVENLTHIYNKGLAYETRAVDDVSFEIADGEFVGIVGHTGSGKSTLIQHLDGILKPDSGKIFIGGKDITEKKVKLIDIRRKVGLVFQYPEYQLFEDTVIKDICFGPKNLGLEEDEMRARAAEAMTLVGLPYEEFAERSPFDLSGGQKRRVAIAGVIAMRPEVLILDEPTAGLDPKAHGDILSMVAEIRVRTGATIILVSHNMGDIAAMADRVIVMDGGKLVADGTPAEVYAKSAYLKSIGLGIPPATELAELIAAGGAPEPSEIILNEEQLLSYIEGAVG
jgi:energy-coupling factor transport system ATP-binding protein